MDTPIEVCLPPAEEIPIKHPSPARTRKRASRRTTAELDAEVPVGTLAHRVLGLMRARQLSAKGLSRSAGLTQDTVRALIRGRVSNPGGRSLAQIAAALGLSVDGLVEGTDLAVVPTQALAPTVTSVARREVEVPEYDLRSRGGVDLPGDPRRVPRHRTWTLPVDLLEEQGVSPGGIAVVRVSGGGDGRRATDRLLVDLDERRPGGVSLLYGDGRYALGRLQPRARGSLVDRDADGHPLEEEVVGRVLAVWEWLT